MVRNEKPHGDLKHEERMWKARSRGECEEAGDEGVSKEDGRRDRSHPIMGRVHSCSGTEVRASTLTKTRLCSRCAPPLYSQEKFPKTPKGRTQSCQLHGDSAY